MLTKLTIRNFKLFEDVELDLADRVVLIGPNNSGKTSALQAIALWDIGLKRWSEKRGEGEVPEKRPGVTINRRDLITTPTPSANLLWRDLRTYRQPSAQSRETVYIETIAEGVDAGAVWSFGLQFYYGNEESFYCRALLLPDGKRMPVPPEAVKTRIGYLPPMSGLSAVETRLDEGAIHVRLGEGRSAEVLRNLCYQVWAADKGEKKWQALVGRMRALFGVDLLPPRYIQERGEITMSYRTPGQVQLDITAAGRGQLQTLLLLAHMSANPGAILLLDEPDAHLEVLRQRQIYQVLSDVAERTHSQIIAASHSEVFLSEAADRDTVIAFVGKPHRIDDRGNQVLRALREVGFDQYALAEETGWVLYLEGSTDLAILRAFARRLRHPAAAWLEKPFVHYVANRPRQAEEHFFALHEAMPKLRGLGIYDRLDPPPPPNPLLAHRSWRKCELENYLCSRETLLAYARLEGRNRQGELFAASWTGAMGEAIQDIESALSALSRPSPWGPDLKVSDDFLRPLFARFFDKLGLPNLMQKTNFHTLAPFVAEEQLRGEVTEVLDLIAITADPEPTGT